MRASVAIAVEGLDAEKVVRRRLAQDSLKGSILAAGLDAQERAAGGPGQTLESAGARALIAHQRWPHGVSVCGGERFKKTRIQVEHVDRRARARRSLSDRADDSADVRPRADAIRREQSTRDDDDGFAIGILPERVEQRPQPAHALCDLAFEDRCHAVGFGDQGFAAHCPIARRALARQHAIHGVRVPRLDVDDLGLRQVKLADWGIQRTNDAVEFLQNGAMVWRQRERLLR